MEMQLRIMEMAPSPGVSSWDITVRIVPEMGGQPPIPGNEAEAVIVSEMGSAPSY